jgi:hypothetical protein
MDMKEGNLSNQLLLINYTQYKFKNLNRFYIIKDILCISFDYFEYLAIQNTLYHIHNQEGIGENLYIIRMN